MEFAKITSASVKVNDSYHSEYYRNDRSFFMEEIMEETEFTEKIFEKIENEQGCPLCSMVMDYEFNMLATIQYEVTQNDSVRKQIAMEGGFCDFHFRQFKKIANYKTNILLLKALVEFGMHKDVNANINCRFCNAVDQFEDELIRYASELFTDKNFLDRFNMSNGLCVIHLRKILGNINDEELKRIILQIHRDQIDSFKPTLEMMNSATSYLNVDISKRGLINVIIQKLVGRKTAGL